MKINKLILIALLVQFLLTGNSIAQVKKSPTKAPAPVQTKYGALAVDRSNGFYYGFSFDQPNRAEAENRAVAECNKRGGACTIVLTYSGPGCAAYRTISGTVGTAFGWGVAKTKEAADEIATKEALKRSGGIQPTNFVWACNSAPGAQLKEIYNASPEITGPVKIGDQVWTTTNLNVSTYRNGDPIYYAANQKEWEKVSREKIPAYCYLNFDSSNDKKY